MCVFVGACGVSGSAWQYMYSFYIHVHVIDTTHCIKKQKQKEKMFILFFVIALFCSIVAYVSVTYLVHVIPIEELFFLPC